MRRCLLAVVVALCALWATPVSARADEVTLERFRDLARRAAADPRALAELVKVDSVDGRPINPWMALGDAAGPELKARLDLLAEAGPGSGAPAASAAAAAALIVSESRFHEASSPQPFAGVLDRIGRALDSAARRLPGSHFTLWALVALAVVASASLVAGRLVGQRARVEPVSGHRALTPPRDPRELDRRAATAETWGDFASAVRLRFQAGLIRLDQTGHVAVGPSSTAAQVARLAHSPTFDDLATTFEDVTYGGRPATAEQAVAAMAGWPQVMREVKRP